MVLGNFPLTIGQDVKKLDISSCLPFEKIVRYCVCLCVHTRSHIIVPGLFPFYFMGLNIFIEACSSILADLLRELHSDKL